MRGAEQLNMHNLAWIIAVGIDLQLLQHAEACCGALIIMLCGTGERTTLRGNWPRARRLRITSQMCADVGSTVFYLQCDRRSQELLEMHWGCNFTLI